MAYDTYTGDIKEAFIAIDSGPAGKGKIALTILGVILLTFFGYLFISGIPFEFTNSETIHRTDAMLEETTSSSAAGANTPPISDRQQ